IEIRKLDGLPSLIDEDEISYSEAINENDILKTGKLDLVGFSNIEKIKTFGTFFTSLILDAETELKELDCRFSRLKSVDFLRQIPNPEKMKKISFLNNTIQFTDISIFDRFTGSSIDYKNDFYGSFESWKDLKELNDICIAGTDIDSCRPRNNIGDKCKAIYDEIVPFVYDVATTSGNYSRKVLEDENITIFREALLGTAINLDESKKIELAFKIGSTNLHALEHFNGVYLINIVTRLLTEQTKDNSFFEKVLKQNKIERATWNDEQVREMLGLVALTKENLPNNEKVINFLNLHTPTLQSFIDLNEWSKIQEIEKIKVSIKSHFTSEDTERFIIQGLDNWELETKPVLDLTTAQIKNALERLTVNGKNKQIIKGVKQERDISLQFDTFLGKIDGWLLLPFLTPNTGRSKEDYEQRKLISSELETESETKAKEKKQAQELRTEIEKQIKTIDEYLDFFIANVQTLLFDLTKQNQANELKKAVKNFVKEDINSLDYLQERSEKIEKLVADLLADESIGERNITEFSNSNSLLRREKVKQEKLEKEIAELKEKLQQKEVFLSEWSENFPNQTSEEVKNEIKLLESQLISLGSLEELNNLLNIENKELKKKLELEKQKNQFTAQIENPPKN
ncbi:13248_t:CDS:10, partial [Funneliformis geosporum]